MMELVTGVSKGVLAGAAGTAAMTAAQLAYYRATGSSSSPAPAEVAKRVVGGVLQREVPEDSDELLGTATHWAYGVGWGAVFGLAAAGRRPGRGVGFGLTVWAASLVHLPAMKLAPPVWEYEPKTIATDVGFHTLYGVVAAKVYRMLGH